MEDPEIPEVKNTRIQELNGVMRLDQIFNLCQPFAALLVTWLFEDLQWKNSQEQGKNHRALLHFINSTFSFESFQLE